ncbi:PREDICTED: phosphoinositide phosphatase SAC5 [Camelina sativa]|uniref:Phosphoinositide phosphatase SAC5 n=1 Tax=Camelina sativa TaxID=90675 RepID=A0ABM1QVL6_CAMSA|nr:PREDICTED: phosphoinositide phosphatase SAC5 [Camelina sativa]
MGSEPRFEPRPELIDLPVLHKFKLYATPSNFYLIGRDENKSFRRILKIDRRDLNELNLYEDPTRYTKEEMRELKRRMSVGNEDSGGFKAITTCYGIIGFVRFLEPYYMLVITKRKKVGEICGHTVYGIAESQMIVIPHPSIQTKVAKSDAEQRYKRLLSVVNLSKNFYFSYTYHLMYTLQKNIGNTERGNVHDNTMFVWNAFLTRQIRRILQNTIWTVALVYGFFQQTKCSVSGEEFVFTIIARRSRHYAGTRYLRRGVNDIGRVANDVETEQIVSKVVPAGQKIPITSIVQIRGSIPLFWSQEASVFNPQPEIILNKKDANYEATKQHFKNLRERYGKKIIILNLLKTGEKKHRENILRGEFAKTIRFINKGVDKENRLKAIHFDLSKHYKKGADGAFNHLCIFARKALELTDLFYCKVPSGVGGDGVIYDSFYNNPLPSQDEEANSPGKEASKAEIYLLQNGVLRTNCIDCLDRTNFAQYAHGLVALGHQLRTLEISGPPVVDLNNPLAIELMEAYQNMGNTLALQYGGSEAHSKMFCDLRGNWNMVTRQRDIFTAMRRHYNNAYQDSDKQNAINVFLGHFRPRVGRPALWELDSDQHNIGRAGSNLDIENMRPLIRRSFSDNILMDCDLNLGELVRENSQPSHEGLNGGVSGANLDFPFCETEPASLSFLSVMRNEDLLRETRSGQMFPGSSSNYVAHRPTDVPGFAHSYKTKFTPAEEMFERCSSRSCSSDNLFTDLDESVTSLTNTNSSFDFPIIGGSDLLSGFSNEFARWVFSGRPW